jgi:hypothetical protein
VRIAALEDDVKMLLTGELAANLVAHFKERDILHLLDLVQVSPETHHATNLEWLQSCHEFLIHLGETVGVADEEPILPTRLVGEPRHKAPGIGSLTRNGRHSVVLRVPSLAPKQLVNFPAV